MRRCRLRDERRAAGKPSTVRGTGAPGEGDSRRPLLVAGLALLPILLFGSAGFCRAEATPLSPILELPAPQAETCLGFGIPDSDVAEIWTYLGILDREHDRLAKLLAMARPKLPYGAAEYEKLFPYSWRCGKAEPAIYYCVEQLRRDADDFHELVTGKPVGLVVLARAKQPLMRAPRPVQDLLCGVVRALDRIHEVNGEIRERFHLDHRAGWPADSLDGTTTTQAIGLAKTRFLALARESSQLRQEIEERGLVPKKP